MPHLPSPLSEDEASFFSLAAEYLEAAEILARTPSTRLRVTMVIRYLLGHSAELLLKSLLHKHGVSLKDLKDNKIYGHNLSKLVKQAKAMKLIGSEALHSVEAFSKTYSSKHTEYRQNVAMQFPSLDSLMREVRELEAQVFDHVAHFTSGV